MSIVNIRFLLIAVAFLSLAGENAFAQNGVNSPYSRFGLGDLEDNGFAQNRAMGGLGIGLFNPKAINIANPASYGYFKQQSFLFEVGLHTRRNNLVLSDTSQTTFGTSITYFALGFPITKWWGSSFGIKPFSKINYRVVDQASLTNIGNVDYTFAGKGGLNQVYWGNGFKYKDFSIGINASYLFGPFERSRREIFESTYIFNYYTIESENVGGFHFDYGMLYSHTYDSLSNKALQDKLTLSGGISFSLGTKLNSKRSVIGVTFNDYLEEPFLIFPVDTTINVSESGKIVIPGSFGIGISAKIGDKWLFGIDYFTQFWSNFSSFGVKDSLINSNRFSAGVQFNPDYRSNNYLKTVFYRLGFYYENTYLQLKGTKLNKYGTSFGIGLPLRKYGSILNLGYEIGRRGTVDNNLIEENYWSIHFGLTINDIWFLKRKYD